MIKITVEALRCSACGTVTTSMRCDCNRWPVGHDLRMEPRFEPYDISKIARYLPNGVEAGTFDGAAVERLERLQDIKETLAREEKRKQVSPTKKKQKPFDPSKALEPSNIVVEDPIEIGAKLNAVRALRNDPLAGLHSRRFIDEAQYQAGRAFQHDFETAERGPRAIDPSKEAVDGGRIPEPITDWQVQAVARLIRAERSLGQSGSSLVHDVLIYGRSMNEIATSRNMTNEAEIKYIGRRFRECLDSLAIVYGFAMRKSASGACNG